MTTGVGTTMETARRIPKPRPGEYPTYAGMCLDLLPDADRLLEHLRTNLRGAIDLVANLPGERLLRSVIPKKIGPHTVDVRQCGLTRSA